MKKTTKKINNWNLFSILLACVISINTGGMLHLENKINKLTEHKTETTKLALTDMTASAYAVTDFPGKAALGDKPKCGKDVAVSRDRLDLLGKRVYIREKYGDALGVFTVVDIMRNGPSNTIDILVPDRKHATDFGRKEVEVYVIHN